MALSRTLVEDTPKKLAPKQKVLLRGRVSTLRDHGKIVFIDLVDRSGVLQVVGDEKLSPLRPQDVVEIIGSVRGRPQEMVNKNIPTGEIEVLAEEIKVLAKAQELPFDMGQEDLVVELPTLLDNRALTLRHPKQKAILKVQEVVIDSFRKALKEKGFTEFQAPSIIPEAPEGGADVFEIKYFDHKAYLAQSPQLYKQIMVGVFERVFTVNKIFRAEPSITTRHLTEVVSLDAEFGFIDSWLDIVEMAEYTIKYIFREVEKECKDELTKFAAKVPLIKEKIPVVKLREAQEIIFKRTGVDHRKEKDLAPEDEREICKWALEEKGSELVFVSHYPTKSRPFYTYPDPEDPEFNQGVDMIGRGYELMTGGRRIEDYETLIKHAKEWGVDINKIELYLQAFRYGMPPEGGFAFGAERVTQGILGLKNVREAIPFPRDMERIDIRLSTLKDK
ncbi:aspartate--tRNA(Asn) ligase [Candidatus Woesebacteria bacterium]|nr:aspartate--tRNA(Asn) ligase [Candidatus Woesebacteria bacterium]